MSETLALIKKKKKEKKEGKEKNPMEQKYLFQKYSKLHYDHLCLAHKSLRNILKSTLMLKISHTSRK